MEVALHTFSDWQLDRLRDAIHAFKYYHCDSFGDRIKQSWKDVSAAIEEYTGVLVRGERLRTFTEGENKKSGNPKYTVLQPESLDAVYRFVTDDDIALLSEGELIECMPAEQAPLQLMEYLAVKDAQPSGITSALLDGRYSTTQLTDEFIVKEVTLQNPTKNGLFQVVERELFFAAEASEDFENWTPNKKIDECFYRMKYSGWGILTPEANLLFFLKDDNTGKNRYYITLASDLSSLPDVPPELLVLLKRENHEFETFAGPDQTLQKITDNIQQMTMNNTFLFTRMTERVVIPEDAKDK